MKDSRCFGCGRQFTPNRKGQMYCCPRCRQKSRNKYSELILPTKGKWFDLILNKIKLEEYRERKPYWEKRFKNYFGWAYGPTSANTWGWRFPPVKKDIIFRNGYGRNAPQFTAECTIEEKAGKTEWGAEEGELYFTLKIHRIYNLVHCEGHLSTNEKSE